LPSRLRAVSQTTLQFPLKCRLKIQVRGYPLNSK
jgi:hypothetical protein